MTAPTAREPTATALAADAPPAERNRIPRGPREVGVVENVIWPVYLDRNRTRAEGRRVPLTDAIEEPTVDEIASAVGQVGYDAVIERDVTHPREYEPRGRVLVKGADDASKNDLVQAAAAYVAILRD